jgi:hypothetical protein
LRRTAQPAVLLVQVFQHFRQAGRQVVVQQNGAGVEVLQPEPAAGAHQRLDGQRGAVGQVECGRRLDRVVERAQPHIQAGLVKDLRQALNIRQIEGVARVLLGDQQQVLRFGADLLDRRHRRLHGQRQHLGRQVVEATGVQVCVHRRQLEAGIAQIDRGVKRRRVLHPLKPKPAFDRRQRFEDALLQFIDRACERGDEVRNHGLDPGTRKENDSRHLGLIVFCASPAARQ